MSKFSNVTIDPLANVYFDGRIVSHTATYPDGSKKTLGIIFPGTYELTTDAAELMEIIDGSCEVTINGSDTTRFIPTDESFNVDGKSGFKITVNAGTCQYVCSYL